MKMETWSSGITGSSRRPHKGCCCGAGRRSRLAEEMRVLRPLPERRLDTTRRMQVRVSPGSLIQVHRNSDSGASRLIGELVEVRLKADTVEVWYGERKMEELPRLRGRGKHRVDYRHIIDWLVRKPGAFENYRYREELFPTSWFRMSFDALREQCGPRRGAKEYVQILALAARRAESMVKESLLRALLKPSPERLSAAALLAMLEEGAPRAPITAVEVEPVSLAVFDEFLSTDEVAA
jgi:hypothetical protein